MRLFHLGNDVVAVFSHSSMSEKKKISLTHLHPIKIEAQNNLQNWMCAFKTNEKRHMH